MSQSLELDQTPAWSAKPCNSSKGFLPWFHSGKRAGCLVKIKFDVQASLGSYELIYSEALLPLAIHSSVPTTENDTHRSSLQPYSFWKGLLTISGALPIKMILDYNDCLINLSKFGSWWLSVLGYYWNCFLLSGYKEQRRVLGLYLLVLIIQIVTEQVWVTVWLLEVSFRLRHYGRGQQLTTTAQIGTRSRTIIGSLLLLLLF